MPAASATVSRALREDLGKGDITSREFLSPDRRAEGAIVAHAPGILCGTEVAREVFRQVDRRLQFRVRKKDGFKVRPGTVCATIRGRARSILSAERTALNFVQRLSGVATITRRFVDAVRGTRAKIYDTRKTTPGLRALEKYAVRCGGGENHRMGLYDVAMIKENHLALCGDGLEGKIRKLRRRVPVILEAQNMREVRAAAELPVDIVLLDNFRPPALRRAVRLLRDLCPKVRIEASGGVTLRNLRAVARTGVDRISVGALTHSAPALDFSLDVTGL